MTKRLSLLSATLIFPLLVATVFLMVRQAQAGSLSPVVCSTCTYKTIQDAATFGPENTPMVIAAGTYAVNVEITRSVQFVGESPLTVIDGQMLDTAVYIRNNPTVSLSNLTIRGGDVTSVNGVGLLNEGGTVSLEDVIIEDNLAPSGGGIANNDTGTMILNNVTIQNNVADEIVGNISNCLAGECPGGGILNQGTMTITNSTIQGNTAQFGGGIENDSGGVLWLTVVTVYGNSAQNNPGEPSAGGGVENLGTMTVTSSTIRNNDAPFGAGIANGGTLTITGSNIYANVAATRGGGIHNTFNLTVETSNIYNNQAGSGGGGGISSEAGDVLVTQTAVYNNSAQLGGGILHNVSFGTNSLVIINSTLSGNSATGTGGGIRNAGIANTELHNVTVSNNSSVSVAGQSISVNSGTLSAQNSIISSAGTNCGGTVSSNGYNLASDNSCGLSGTADLVNVNPQLGPLQNNGGSTLTRALLLGSPAINSGSGCPAVDQRGVARPVGTACDRGAYEFGEVFQSVYLPMVIRP